MELTNEQKHALTNVELTGEISIEECNEANVPVNLFLNKGEGENEGFWTLSGDTYMPRKNRGAEGIGYRAKDQASLQKLIELFVKPLYVVALSNINGMIDGTKDCHYYWE